MKKVSDIAYYISPFIIIPVVNLLFCSEFFNRVLDGYIEVSFMSALLIMPFMIATFSPSKHKFDHLITIFVPLSMMLVIFLCGFFSPLTEGGPPGCDLGYALKLTFQRSGVILYVIMSLITFVSSFYNIRLRKLFKKKKATA